MRSGPVVFLVPLFGQAVLADIVREHPAVLVVGPRATGKTTTCERHAASSIELGSERQAAAANADAAALIRDRASVVLHPGGHVADLGGGVVGLPIASLWNA